MIPPPPWGPNQPTPLSDRLLDDAGGQDYLAAQAHKNPAAFLALVGRVLPREPAVEPPKHITLNFGRELHPRPAIENAEHPVVNVTPKLLPPLRDE